MFKDMKMDFLELISQHISEETPIIEETIDNFSVKDESFCNIEIKNSRFISCSFIDCDLENSTFIGVGFENCDFSNSNFKDSYFSNCKFKNCKCIGIRMEEAILKNVITISTNFQYANFDGAKITLMICGETDFTEASLSEVKLKDFKTTNSKFIKTNFFKTSLKDVDFTQNELVSPIVSSSLLELKGSKIDMFQAADLVSLLGVRVEKSL